jgi:hypothetical protein
MKDAKKTKKFWQEWGAFCDLLLEGTRAFDSGKPLPDHQKIDPCPASDCSKELDMFLRFFFEPPSEGLPPGIFDETPPLLEKALALRIAHATEILKKILETHDGPEIQSESDLAKAAGLSFRDLLLPSPPPPGEYTWKKTV